MAERTGIEWADATWNPWMGCKKVSAGCKSCYMFRDMKFYGRNPNEIVRASHATFGNPIKWVRRKELKKGARIFTCSWSDFFIEEADLWRTLAWDIIKSTSFIYLILTKRPERILEHLPNDWGTGYLNVWLLISAEDQIQLHKRWDCLRDIPATVKGISAEPLLSQISLGSTIRPDWVITGGESDNKNPRTSNPEWFRFLRDQCLEKNIPFFHKQNGGSKKINGAWGGRLLDGRTWDEYPKAK